MKEEFQDPGVRLPDNMIASAAQMAVQTLNQQIQPLAQLWAMASKVAAAKSPQPPVDPAVQKTYEAAMAEINRKAQADQQDAVISKAEFGLKQQSQQFEQQQVVQEMQRQAQQSQAEFQKEVQEFTRGMQQAQEALQATIKKNNDDFLIKLMTLQAEIEKRDKDHAEKLAEAMRVERPDFTPHIKQMSDMLGQVKESRTSESLDSMMQSLNALMQVMAAPTDISIIRDETGRPVGARKQLSHG